MRLNLGCGEQYADDWHNVDFKSPHRKDETVDLTGELPWPAGSVAQVYAGHLLEHLTLDECAALLSRIKTCMVRYGAIMIVGPDVELAEVLQLQGYALEVPLEQLKYGAGRWAGDEHKWLCTRRQLTDLLQAAGFKEIVELSIDQVPRLWPVAFRGPKWQVGVGGLA